MFGFSQLTGSQQEKKMLPHVTAEGRAQMCHLTKLQIQCRFTRNHISAAAY